MDVQSPSDHRIETPTAEHPLDVLEFINPIVQSGDDCAIAMLVSTEGGSVRAPGAIMAITASGHTSGYLSGGCVDADIVIQAQQTMREQAPRTVRYGKGSPFLDISLPCGGAIEVHITPASHIENIDGTIKALRSRQSAVLNFLGKDIVHRAKYFPKLRLRIAGRSADPIALAHTAAAAKIDVELWSADPECLATASAIEGLKIKQLDTPRALPSAQDDPKTAFVLMMHDADWEVPLLKQALGGPAFYIGAVGSPRTHRVRRLRLSEEGLSEADIDRVHGPIGLVPSLRDASMLAISTLA